jgi:transposase-like protein
MELQKYTPQSRRPTPAERLQMVERFRRSGLTRVAFSHQYGIPLATLSWWLSKAKNSTNVPAPVAFSEIKLMPPTEPTIGWAMELESPSGLVVRCRTALDPKDLMCLLRG